MSFAAIREEQIGEARRDELTHRCEECRVAAGVAFFDRRWVCANCREALRFRLSWEPYEFDGGSQMIDHAVRRRAIGGSDIGALFGVGFKDEFGVWATKKGGLEPQPSTARMITGQILEPAVLGLYEYMTGLKLQLCDTTRQHPTRPFQVYSPDALAVEQRRGVDAKVVHWDQRGKWGWEADEVPEHIQFQCWWYCSAMDYEKWDVAALAGEGLPRIFTIQRLDARHENAMLKRAEEWWERYIVGDERPPLGHSEDAARWLQRTYPQHARPDMREATREEIAMLDEYVVLRLEQKKLVQARNTVELLIKDAIKDREGLTWDGNRFTWRKSKDGENVDWESIARGLLNTVDEHERETLIGLHTTPKPGTRRIHVTHPLLNRGARSEGAPADTETDAA